MGCILYESGTHEAECHRKLISGRKVAGAIRSLIDARNLRFEYARVLHESLFVSVRMYGSETYRKRSLGLRLYR